MDIYYAIMDHEVIALTWAKNIEHARDQLELALADEGHYDTEDLEINRFPRTDGTVVLNLREMQ